MCPVQTDNPSETKENSINSIKKEKPIKIN